MVAANSYSYTTWREGDFCYWRGYRADIQVLYKDAPYALLVLYPQPGVTGDTRWQTAEVKELRRTND